MINQFSEVAGYKINIQKVALLYANNKHTEREIKKEILFTIATKKPKSLVINLIKSVKDLCNENCHIMMKEIKDTKNEHILLAHRSKESISLKCL